MTLLAVVFLIGQTGLPWPISEPAVPIFPDLEWADQLTLQELKSKVSAKGDWQAKFSADGSGYADFVMPTCTVNFWLSPAPAHREPVVEMALALKPDGALIEFPEASRCMRAVTHK